MPTVMHFKTNYGVSWTFKMINETRKVINTSL